MRFEQLEHVRAEKTAAVQPFDRRQLLSVPVLAAVAGLLLRQPAWGATTGTFKQIYCMCNPMPQS